jgi:hypothetical protein
MSIKSFLVGLFGGSPSRISQPSGRNAPASRPPRRPGRARDCNVDSSVLTVDSLQFIGICSRSKDKRWVAGYTDRLPGSNPRPGSNDGSALLVNYPEDRVVVRISGLERPMATAVSDAGTFLLNDANAEERLSGDVKAFDTRGQQIFRRTYAANLFNLDISRCGRYGAVQTANAPNGDGNLLELLDLQAGTILFSIAPRTGWADQYGFAVRDDGELRRLTVIHTDLGKFNYSAKGEFLDKGDYQSARLQKGSPEKRIYGAKDVLSESPEDRQLAEVLVGVVDKALSEVAKERLDYRSLGLRVKGEALELLGRQVEALSAYEDAIALNPKVGVAKRIAALRKKLR